MLQQQKNLWRDGEYIYARDSTNEQTAPLAAGATFTGKWKRIDQFEGFLLLYGTNQPFTMRIQWSKDGVTQDVTANITPQVRNLLGIYSVISPQDTYLRAYYREVIINGPNAQAFVSNNALLLPTKFQGYVIGIDGPIPILGLGHLNSSTNWGRNPTAWAPIQLTALNNQKMALAENLLGPLPVTGALSVDNFPSDIAVNNFPPVQVVAEIGSTYTHRSTIGTVVIKGSAGVLERVIINTVGNSVTSTVTLHDGLTAAGPIIAVIKIGANVAGNVLTPAGSLDFFAAFPTGLTAVFAGAGFDVTIVTR